LACGHLELLQKVLFGGNKWVRFLVVLSNVGILYFKDPLEAPVDFLPMLNCVLTEVSPEEVDGSMTVFRIEYARKKFTFRCSSHSEFN